MPSLDQLKQALIQADRAGDQQSAAAIADMIRQAQAAQQPQEPGWGEALAGGAQRLPGDAWEAVSGIPGAVAEFASHPGQSIDQTLGGLGDLITGGLVNAGVPALSEQDREAAELAAQFGRQKMKDWDFGRGTKERIMNDPLGPIGDFLAVASIPTGAAGLGAKALGAGRTASLLDKISRRTNPIAPFTNIVARGVQKAEQGLARMLATRKFDDGPDLSDIPTGAMAQVSRALDLEDPEARGMATRLGEDVSLYNLTPRAVGQAEAIMGTEWVPKKARKELLARATQVQEEQVPKFRERVNTALDAQPMSQFDAYWQRDAKRKSAQPLYQAGAKKQIDVKPINEFIRKMADENDNNKKLMAALKEASDALWSPRAGRTGDWIKDASRLKTVRSAIRDRIEELGVSKDPLGRDPYSTGAKDDYLGRHLARLEHKITEELHKVPEIRKADEIYREAAEEYEYSKMGRTDVVGSGKTFTEPQVVALKMLQASTKAPGQAKALDKAAREGLAQALHRLSGQKTSGLSMENASFKVPTHEEVKASMAAIGGPQAADEIAEVAGNQDILMGDAQALQRAYVKGEKEGGAGMVEGETPAYTRRGFFQQMGISPTFAAAGSYVAGQPALGTLLLSKGIFDRLTGKGVSPKTAAGMAQLYAKHGADVGGILDIIENIPKPLRKSRTMDQLLLGAAVAANMAPDEEERKKARAKVQFGRGRELEVE